jgi:predicted metal-dependent peptidase
MSDKAMTVQDKMTYAKVRLLIRHKLFGLLLLDFPLREAVANSGIDTMATDNVNIFYHSPWVKKLTKNQTMTVVLHEILHIMLKHFMRFDLKNIKTQEERMMVNYALDYAVNSIIINEMMPHDNLLELPTPHLYDEKFKGMNAEKILEILKKEKKENPEQHKERFGGAGSGEGQEQFDNHDISSEGTQENVKAKKASTGKSLKDQMGDIDKKIFKASSGLSAKEKGEVPADMQRLIDEYLEELEGHVDWRRFIRRKLQEIGKGQYTTSRCNRAYMPYGFYFPGQTGAKAKVALALDTSGSISNEDITEFLVELRSMLRMMPGLEIVLYGCDSDIHGMARIKGLKNFRKSVGNVLTGGGGTSFIPVFKDLAENKDRDIKALFYFTDGYGDQNQIQDAVPNFKWETFWVLQKENRRMDFPFGKKVIIWDEKGKQEEE